MNGEAFLQSKGIAFNMRLTTPKVAKLLDEFAEYKKNLKQYVIISLKHTTEKDLYVTFWRPDDAGYCWCLEDAGVYEKPEKGYHDNEENRPVEYEKVKALCVTISKEKSNRLQDGKFLPNNSTILRRLGINL